MKGIAVVLAFVLLAFIGLIVAGKLRGRGGGWAVVDGAGKPVSALRFDDAGAFAGGLGAVKLDGRWGYADRDGRVAIAPRFTRAEPFAGEHAVAEEGAMAGVIDRRGAWVLAPAYRRVLGVVDGVAVVVAAVGVRTTGPGPELSVGLVRVDGTVIVAPAAPGDPARWHDARLSEDGRLAVRRDDGWHRVDLDGTVIGAGELPEERADLSPEQAEDRRWGFVDRDGRWAIAAQWGRVGEEGFRAGRARVARAAGLDYEWAFVGPDGAVIDDRWYADVAPSDDPERALARL